MHEDGMSENQVYQLLREIELVDESGDYIWEENLEIDEETMVYKEDEDEMNPNHEVNLPDDILPHFENINIQQIMDGRISRGEVHQKKDENANNNEKSGGVRDDKEHENLEEELGKKNKKLKKWGPMIDERKSLRL
uniref:Uncharacterized protein n=1 Tax=Arundo donax TaxID=35708 RepID=A0A0A8ZIW5_ARUDO